MRMRDPFGNMEARLREMDVLRREIERLFEGTGGGPRGAFLPGRAARAYPLINMSEDHDNFYVEALAPGIDPQKLEVSVVRNTLTLSGEKTAPSGVAVEAFHRSERSAGRFVRTVELPSDVDSARVQARYADGLLTITLPKHEAAKPRQIQVAVS